MNLSAPKNLTWIIAVVLGVLGLLGNFVAPSGHWWRQLLAVIPRVRYAGRRHLCRRSLTFSRKRLFNGLQVLPQPASGCFVGKEELRNLRSRHEHGCLLL